MSETLANVITTLVVNGFNMQRVERFPDDTHILDIYRFDKLGGRIDYSLLLTSDTHETAIVDTLIRNAGRSNATPLVISDTLATDKCKCYKIKDFFGMFGGLVNTGLILIPSLDDILESLGHNKVYPGLVGDADDLHELYVNECLQYMLQSPTRRYGSDRLFEKVPDAVVLSKERFMVLVDSKAYSKGFEVKADDMLRFKGYVEDFRERYSHVFGSIQTFLVVSGHFQDSERALRGRSDELYGTCGCKLSYANSAELGRIVKVLNDLGDGSQSIIWRGLLTNLFITKDLVDEEIKRIKKDSLH